MNSLDFFMSTAQHIQSTLLVLSSQSCDLWPIHFHAFAVEFSTKLPLKYVQKNHLNISVKIFLPFDLIMNFSYLTVRGDIKSIKTFSFYFPKKLMWWMKCNYVNIFVWKPIWYWWKLFTLSSIFWACLCF